MKYRSKVRYGQVRRGLAHLKDHFESQLAFEHWQRVQAQARKDLLVELVKLWDSDLGDLSLKDLQRMRLLETILQVCSYHPPKGE